MIVCSAALKAHLSQPYQTTTTCWLVRLRDGSGGDPQVRGFTAHNAALTFDLEAWMITQSLTPTPGIAGTGSVVYAAETGYTPSDIAGAADLSPDNLETDGVLSSPSITEADLNAGIWDFASVTIFLVNWADLSMGALILRSGKLGEVTVGRENFKAELRGVSQAYSRTIGALTSPGCRANLGDAQCKVDLAPFTDTATLTGVGTDGVTLFASSLTQPGPTGAVSITSISKANPGVVTTATPLDLAEGSPISMYAITGMTALNGDTFIRNPSGNTFELGVDTSAYPTYTGGGEVVPLGGSSGYFAYGVITFTSGNNDGFSMEIKSYVPGQITLQLPMPYTCQVGDTFSIVAGCGKGLITDCKTRFNNVVNFRGEYYLPGIDRLVQVGKQG